MSNEEKQEMQMNDEKRAFIREQIVPKRGGSFKRLLLSVGRTSLLAILFGVVGSFVFSVMSPYFDQVMGKEDDDTVVFVQPTQSPVATQKPAKEEETEKNEEGKGEIKEQTSAVVDVNTYKRTFQMMKEIADRFNHSVVTVSGVQSGVDWFDNPAEASDATSGVIIADSGKKIYILTSYTKIADVSHIQVTFENEETVEAVLQGRDKDTNIAVIYVEQETLSEGIRKKLKVAAIGDSYYAQKGTPVLALGNPTGYMYSMETGMITGDAMEQYITDSMVELVATNINAVEGGEGVLIDFEGNILGIITHQFEGNIDNSMCKAIAVNRVKSIIETIINGTERVYFGIVASNIPDEYKESLGADHGIYVMEVANKSPALAAGIQVGDIITDIGGKEVSSITGFNVQISLLKPKSEVQVKVLRTTQLENKQKTLTVTLGSK